MKHKKQLKPGALFNAFHKKKAKHKKMSEADAGSMGGYNPNLGLERAGYRKAMGSVTKTRTTGTSRRLGSTANDSSHAVSPNRSPVGNINRGGTAMNAAALGGVNTMRLKKKHSKKHKKSMKHCKTCGK